MASNSGRRSGSSGRSTGRKRVVIGAEETVRVRYNKDAQPQVESERHRTRTAAREGGRAEAQRDAARAGKRLSATKREERERRQRVLRVRRGALGVAVLAVVALCAWGGWALYRAPILPVTRVEVVGNERLASKQVRALAAIPDDATLINVSTREVRDRLVRDPWIASAVVRRALPGTVLLTITERTPAAAVDIGGSEVWLISGDGHWLGERSAEASGLPVVRELPPTKPEAGAPVQGAEVQNVLAILNGMTPWLKERVVEIAAPSVEETALRTRREVEIFVGSADQLELKDRVVQELLTTKKDLVYINVRVPESPTWRGLAP